jgi:hypothetical protein
MVQDFPDFPTRVGQFNFHYQTDYSVVKSPLEDRVFHLLGNQIDHPQIVNDTQYPVKIHYCQKYHTLVIPPHDTFTLQESFPTLGSSPVNIPIVNYILDHRFSLTFRKGRTLVDHERMIEFYVTADVLYESYKFTSRCAQFAIVHVMSITSTQRIPRAPVQLE